MVTIPALRAAGATLPIAQQFAIPLNEACERYSITTPRRIAAFLAQCSVESGSFTRLRENLNYTTPERLCKVFPSRFKTLGQAVPYLRNPEKLANLVYANRNGNGDEASGEGAKFLGRGFVQLTGRDNYTAAADDIGIDYAGSPDLVEQPAHAALTSAWFFSKNGCNELADLGKIDEITRRVNGRAMLEAELRRERYHTVLKAIA